MRESPFFTASDGAAAMRREVMTISVYRPNIHVDPERLARTTGRLIIEVGVLAVLVYVLACLVMGGF